MELQLNEDQRMEASFLLGRVKQSRARADALGHFAEIALVRNKYKPAGAAEVATRFQQCWPNGEDIAESRRCLLALAYTRDATLQQVSRQSDCYGAQTWTNNCSASIVAIFYRSSFQAAQGTV